MASDKSSQPQQVEALDEQGLWAIRQNFEALFRDITSGFSLENTDDSTGTLAVTSGGTGLSTVSAGGLLYGSATDTLAVLSIGSSGKVLRSNGSLPVWSTFTIADTFTSGTVLRASSANTLAGSSWTIQASFGTGGMIYASGTNTLVQLDIGSAGQVIRSTGTIPAYSTFTISNTFATGSILHASATNTVTALAVGGAGTIIRSTGTLPAYTTFTIPNTFATGDLLHASATNVVSALAVGAAGTILVGGATVPSYTATPTITTSVTVPLVIGGTAVGSILTLKSTSGVGTTDAIVFQVGNNGATEAARFITSGFFGIGTTTPVSKLHIEGANGWIIQDEQDTNPTATELDADDSIAIYSKADTLVFAYNNGGTITYVKLALDGSSTTWVHDTSAP